MLEKIGNEIGVILLGRLDFFEKTFKVQESCGLVQSEISDIFVFLSIFYIW